MSVEITVKLFGPQAQSAQARELRLVLAGSPTVGALRAALAAAVPALAPSLASSRLAVNHEFAADSDAVSATDEVALIGMVSGG